MVKTTVKEAFENKLLPFDQMVDELQIERVSNRTPVFDVSMVFHNYEDNHLADATNFEKDSDLKISPVDKQKSESMFDILFNFSELENNFHLSVDYNSDLYKAETIESIGRDFIKLTEIIQAGEQLSLTGMKKQLLPQAHIAAHEQFTNSMAEQISEEF